MTKQHDTKTRQDDRLVDEKAYWLRHKQMLEAAKISVGRKPDRCEHAHSLENPKFAPRIVPSKKAFKRTSKHKDNDIEIE